MQPTEAIHSPQHSGERHETTDLSVKVIAAVLSCGAVFVFLVLVGVYWLFFAYGTIDHRFLDNPPMTTIKTAKIEPREPRVQGIPGYHTNLPWQDTVAMKKETSAQLASYGHTDNSQYVHIPIMQAMRDVAGDGSLKVRNKPNVPNQGGADVAP